MSGSSPLLKNLEVQFMSFKVTQTTPHTERGFLGGGGDLLRKGRLATVKDGTHSFGLNFKELDWIQVITSLPSPILGLFLALDFPRPELPGHFAKQQMRSKAYTGS